MALSKVIVKTLVGAAFTGFGYYLTESFCSLNLLGVPHLLPTLVGFVAGAFSILALPILGFKISSWAKSFVGTVIRESLSEFLEAQFDRVRETASRLRSREGSANFPEQLPSLAECQILLDTSAIIDGRILDIIKAGFLPGRFLVPRFVLDELQGIADSKDDLRRKKGRRGLEILKELRGLKGADFEVLEAGLSRGEEVDRKLIELAQASGAYLLTVDFNLNRTAQVSGVKVLNINQLANALKTILVPGERVEIKIISEGKGEGQGVGYLDDGTMVVVEGGKERIGRKVTVEVTRVLQTEAGRMVFAQLVSS